MKLNKESIFKTIRKWSHNIHRDLGFFFSGMIIIYGISGFFMNHLDKINPNYTIDIINFTIEDSFPSQDEITDEDVLGLLKTIGAEDKYTKHYFPEKDKMKVFIKGGSNLNVDLFTRQAVYEKLTQRTILSNITKLHYNPGRWWTYFSDMFAISLVLITITGLIMIKGPKGFIGRGGIEFALGIIIPILFLIL